MQQEAITKNVKCAQICNNPSLKAKDKQVKSMCVQKVVTSKERNICVRNESVENASLSDFNLKNVRFTQSHAYTQGFEKFQTQPTQLKRKKNQKLICSGF